MRVRRSAPPYALPAWAPRGERQGPPGARRTVRVRTRSSAPWASAASARIRPVPVPYAPPSRSPWIRRGPPAPRDLELQALPVTGAGAAPGQPALARLRRSWIRAAASPPSRPHRQVRAHRARADAASPRSRLHASGSRGPAGGPAGVAGRSSRRPPCWWTRAGSGTPHGAVRSQAGSRRSASHSRRRFGGAPRDGDASMGKCGMARPPLSSESTAVFRPQVGLLAHGLVAVTTLPPSHPVRGTVASGQGFPFTVAGPHRILTGFPVIP